jgi:hypothetical protein
MIFSSKYISCLEDLTKKSATEETKCFLHKAEKDRISRKKAQPGKITKNNAV